MTNQIRKTACVVTGLLEILRRKESLGFDLSGKPPKA
jgi:hypothetical protein